MSTCPSVTLCDPNTGDQILVTNPNSADAAGFVLPAMTAYAGDLAALVKCVDAPSVELLDCDGNPITTATPLTQDAGHAPALVGTSDLSSCVDPDCAPELPDCPIEGSITFTEGGITWQIIGGVWVPVAITPRSGVINVQQQGALLDDAALAAQAAGGPAQQTITTAQTDVTNTDCVTWYLRVTTRSVVQFNSNVPGNLWVANIQNPAANDFDFNNGSPGSTYHTLGLSGEGEDQRDYIEQTEFEVALAPGATSHYETYVRLGISQYASDPANTFQVIGHNAKIEWFRSCP